MYVGRQVGRSPSPSFLGEGVDSGRLMICRWAEEGEGQPQAARKPEKRERERRYRDRLAIMILLYLRVSRHDHPGIKTKREK